MPIRAHMAGGFTGDTDGSAFTHLTTLETEQSMSHTRDAVLRKLVRRRRLRGIELDEVELREPGQVRRALRMRGKPYTRAWACAASRSTMETNNLGAPASRPGTRVADRAPDARRKGYNVCRRRVTMSDPGSVSLAI